MEAERDDNEEAERQQLNDETDFHDAIASLLGRNVVGNSRNAAHDLDEKGNHVASHEDRRHISGWNPQAFCVAIGFGCYVENDSTLIEPLSVTNKGNGGRDGSPLPCSKTQPWVQEPETQSRIAR